MREIHKQDTKLLKLLPPQIPLEGIRYVPSQFTLPFERCGKKYVFNTLTKQCLETELPSFAKSGSGSDDLIRQRFLVPEGKDECAFYNSVSAVLRASKKKEAVPSFVVMTTLCCNARCVYCYEEGLKQTNMSDDTADDTTLFILKTCGSRPVKITWFGGEPLLRENVIDRISTGLLEAGVRFSSTFSTNGSLITPSNVKKMAGLWNTRYVNISMDGSEQDYISRKRYYNYRDYYHAVIDAADLISEEGIGVSVRCNVDLENIDSVSDLIKDLASGIKTKSNVCVYPVPLYQVCATPDILKLFQKILDLRETIVSAGFTTISNEYLDLSLRTVHCMADGCGFTVAPDGSLYCCELMAKGSLIGNVRDGITDKEAKANFGHVTDTREKCRKCVFLPECTSLSTCPKYYDTCLEMRTLVETDELRRMVDSVVAGSQE